MGPTVAALQQASAQIDTSGNLHSFIETIRNAMPGQNSNAFVVPGDDDLAAFSSVIAEMNAGRYTTIQQRLDEYHYRFFRFINSSTSDTFMILRENIPVQRGWGTYVVRPSASSSIAIEIPHPVWDTKSWRLGTMVFLRLNARWMFMAGTHRYANSDNSSDVAHVTRAVFYAAHAALAPDPAIQIHGFGKSDPSYDGYPDIVISNGTVYPPNVLFTLKSNFETKGFTAGVFSISTQSALSQLGATTNKEGQWSGAHGKTFIHIESDTPIRTDSAKSLKYVASMAATFPALTDVHEGSGIPGDEVQLQPCYPNPFNPSTTVTITLRRKETIRLSVFDIRGEEVSVLAAGTETAGVHTRVWNASGLASGVYYCRLLSGSASRVTKMILVQ